MQKQKSNQKAHQIRVSKVLKFVRHQGERPLTLAELADIAVHSPFYFERIFKEQTGINVIQHVRNVRLVRAAIDLRLTSRKIVEIALDAEYANHESFSRAFRAKFGISPSGYRKKTLSVHQNEKGTIMKNVKIGLVKIPITDFDKSTQYYRETLGLEEEFAVKAYGWAQYKTSNLPLCLYTVGQGGGDGTPGGEQGLHLVVEDIKTVYADIKRRGGLFASAIVESDDGGLFFMVKDPDDNRFKIVQNIM